MTFQTPLSPDLDWEEDALELEETEGTDWSVTRLIEYLNRSLQDLLCWEEIWVTGEVSGWKVYPSGHAYFTLKDGGGQISCTLFKYQMRRLEISLRDGQQVRLQGRVQIYAGRLQFQVQQVQPVGMGDLYEEYCRRKERLEREGLFARKRSLPILPRRVGVVTSPKGAVIRDIIQVSTRRFPGCRILLYPSSVQGNEAAAQLIEGVRALQRIEDVDVIIIGRGGGSIEDLWCFNDENLVRTLFECRVPVVSAVGHETDMTLCDFVADTRAPTPSAAAELVWPELRMFQQRFANLDRHLLQCVQSRFYRNQSQLAECERLCNTQAFQRRIDQKRIQVQKLTARCQENRPDLLLQRKRVYWNQLDLNLQNHENRILQEARTSLELQLRQLQVLDPRQILSRGYALVTDGAGGVVTKIRQVAVHQSLQLELQDGCLQVEVVSKNQEESNGTGS